MSKTEINGFEIDRYNQYDLDEGKGKGICPLCSSDRKPEHQKAECCSYDWERGIATCHHCSEKIQLHTFKRKNEVDKIYVKPNTTVYDSLKTCLLYTSDAADE